MIALAMLCRHVTGEWLSLQEDWTESWSLTCEQACEGALSLVQLALCPGDEAPGLRR